MSPTATANQERVLHRLSAHLPDRVLHPDHPDYDASRRVYFTGVDRRPAAVVRPRNTAEVADAVRIVAGEGGRLTVKGGGHGFSSVGVLDGVVSLDLSELGSVQIDLEARRARAGGGATTGAYTKAAGSHGLATGFGDSPKVGIGGIAQSGGIGFLHRSLGLTADQLLGAEVVTADGEVLEVDGERRPDLFWALRGGGGGFGVVTRLELKLSEVDRITGGMLMVPADPSVLHGYLELLAQAPDALSGIVQVLRVPPVPLFPSELHGTLLLGAYLVHSGDPGDGREWMDRFRALKTPVMDMVDHVPYPALFEEHGGPPDPPHLRWRSVFRDALTRDEVASLFERVEAPHTGILRTVQIRALGGAVARVPEDATAFAHRNASVLVSAGAVFEDPADAETHGAWVAAVQEELAGEAPPRSYAGFLGTDDPGGPAAAWPGLHGDRLRALKERYDPEGRFPDPFEVENGV